MVRGYVGRRHAKRWAVISRVFVFSTVIALLAPTPVRAESDPTIASLLSAASTIMPVSVGAGLLIGGRGADEGLRFDIAISTITAGAIVGPSVGQFYAAGGVDPWVTLLLRTVTGGVMSTGLGLQLRGPEETQGIATAALIVGGIPTLVLAIYDIINAADRAEQSRIGSSSISMHNAEAYQLQSILQCGPMPCPI